MPFVAVPIPSSCGVDPTGHEPQRELAQGGQVRLGEEPVERDPGPILGVDVAVAHPLAERVRAHVDEFDLVGRRQDLVGDPLVDRRARDRRDRVGDRFEVLDVAGADDIDAGVEQDVDVLPALRPLRARRVRVGELVDQGDGGMPRQDRVGVHLLDDDAAILDAAPGDDLQAVEQLRSVSGRPCASTNPTTRSVPRSVRRWPSSSIR